MLIVCKVKIPIMQAEWFLSVVYKQHQFEVEFISKTLLTFREFNSWEWIQILKDEHIFCVESLICRVSSFSCQIYVVELKSTIFASEM